MDRGNVQNIYPLSPVANALLYRRLQSSGGDPGFLQVTLRLKGAVDPDKLREAWQMVTDRQEALRSSIHWKETRRPVQVVRKKVDAVFTHEQDRSGPVEGFQEADRARGVALTRAPIDRLTLLSESGDDHHLIWTTHHLLLDGWSAAVIIEELLHCYAALRNGREPALGPPPKRTAYRKWLDSRDRDEAEVFWSSYLSGFRRPSRISADLPSESLPRFPFPVRRIDLTGQEERRVRETIDKSELTVSGILQMAVAVALSKLGAGEDIAIGVTASGRPAEVPDIDRMTGLFVSTVPVRVPLIHSWTVRETAGELLTNQAGWSKYAFLPLERITDLSELPGGLPLFDCLLVVENFPWQQIRRVDGLGFELVGFEGSLTTTLPLTLAASDSGRIDLRLHYDPERFGLDEIGLIGDAMKRSILAVSKDPDRPIAEVLADVPEAVLATSPEPTGRGDSSRDSMVDGHKAPADATELALARIWSDVLGIQPISPDDDFFELGGRSIQAVQLFDRIEREFDRAFPISAIFEGRSLRMMADLLRDGDRSSGWRTLVPIQPFGNRPPLFCMHAGEGNVNFFYDLARRLGPDQPVFGVEAIGLNGETPPLRDVGEMAELYAGEIHAAQNGRPCLVAGLCLGTMLAVEVAERLEDAGTEVLLHIAFDTAPIAPKSSRDSSRSRNGVRLKPGIVDKILRHSRHAISGDWYMIRRRLRRRVMLAREGLACAWIERFGTERRQWQMEVRKANDAAAWTYSERVVRTPVLLLRSSEFVARDTKTQHLEAWKKFATNVLDVEVVDSTHAKLFEEPAVAQIAEIIAGRIAALESEASQPA